MWRFNTATGLPEKLSSDQEEASSSAEQQPTHFDTTDFGKFLAVGKDKLSVRYTGQALHDNDVGSIQANQKVPRKQLVYYYEMTVVDAGERGVLAIGFAEKGFKLDRHPGWELNSYGYHSDDGKKLTGAVTPSRSGETYGPTYSTGDTVGAGVLLERQAMFFTKNGKNLGIAFRNVLKVPLYPTIGLHSRNEAVEVNFGQQPFVFDLEALVQEERSRQESAVQSAQISSGLSHQIVRDYLLHYGYAETLSSFVDTAGLADEPSTSGEPSTSRRAEDTLKLRHSLRGKIMAGHVEEACKLLEVSAFRGMLHHQQALPGDDGLDEQHFDVYFFLTCLTFIERIAKGKVKEAVDYARLVLSGLRGVFAMKSPAYDAMLADVVALLAYTDPHDSPMRQLLSMGQREAVADLLNSAILKQADSKVTSGSRPQAILERILAQLVTVQGELRSANGGHGQIFSLLDHLNAPRANTVSHGSRPNGVSTPQHSTGNGVAHAR